jgi:hypothetical protein
MVVGTRILLATPPKLVTPSHVPFKREMLWFVMVVGFVFAVEQPIHIVEIRSKLMPTKRTAFFIASLLFLFF